MKSDLGQMIKTLGIDKLPSKTREKILDKVNMRLEEVLLRVMVENLSEDETKKMKEILESGESIEERVAEITAQVPMLAGKMEQAVIEEIERLKVVLKG